MEWLREEFIKPNVNASHLATLAIRRPSVLKIASVNGKLTPSLLKNDVITTSAAGDHIS
jgi:hypothetical protein